LGRLPILKRGRQQTKTTPRTARGKDAMMVIYDTRLNVQEQAVFETAMTTRLSGADGKMNELAVRTWQ
jgi:hypothetical protein